MQSRADHAQEKVGPVILYSTTQNLLVDRNGASTLDVAESVDSSPNAEVANALDIGWYGFVLTVALLTVLDRHLREADTYSTDVATEDVPTIQSLPSSYGVIKTLEVDCAQLVNNRILRRMRKSTY